jgi:hypothetical protein
VSHGPSERLWPPIGGYADSVDPSKLDAAIADSGLTIAQCIELHGEWRERDEEDDEHDLAATDPRIAVDSRPAGVPGPIRVDAYNAVLNNCLWGASTR